MTYAATSKLSVIGGKFVTPEGYEGGRLRQQPEFLGRSCCSPFAEPISHTGIKANLHLQRQSKRYLWRRQWMEWLVSNNDTDVNTAKTIIWQVATTPTKQIGWSVQGLYGKELADPSHSAAADHADTVWTRCWNLCGDRQAELGGQAQWGQQTNDPTRDESCRNKSGHDARDRRRCGRPSRKPRSARASLRFEVMGDQNNANRIRRDAAGNHHGWDVRGWDRTNQTCEGVYRLRKSTC